MPSDAPTLSAIDPAFGHWFAGFADGEGCFYIGRFVHKKPSGKEYVNFCCAFTISLRADDRPILQEIQDQLGGIGRLETRKARSVFGRGGVHPMAALTIRVKADSQFLVQFFDRFPLRAKKASDYAIWREAVLLHAEMARGGGRHKGPHDWTRIAELHEQLKANRAFS